MTDREKAIVMAYTGISMLEGDKLNVFYRYLTELYGRPVYTHELIVLDIEHKSKPDFLKLCDEEDPERKTGKWIVVDEQPYFRKHFHRVYCSNCSTAGRVRWGFCPNCGAYMKGEPNED